MISCDLFESRLNLVVGVKALLVHKTIQSVASKDSFNFTEHSFYGIKFWGVPNVIKALDVEPRPPLLQRFGLMNSELVHEQSKWLVSVFVAEFLKIVKETISINGLRMNLGEAYAIFFSHACDH